MSRVPEGPTTTNTTELTSIRVQTDRSEEVVKLHRSTRLPGIDFWSVQNSERHWSMLHDTYTACFVHGPAGSVRGRWRSRGEERRVSAGCVQLMEPGEVHRTTAVSEPASFFVVWWSPATMAEAAAELGVSSPVHWCMPQLERNDVSTTMARLAASVATSEEPLAIEQWFAEATGALVGAAAERGANTRKPRRKHPNVRRAVELLRDTFAQRVSLDDLAREARLSKFHLARCFREATGLAPHQYQKLLRVQAARRCLERGLPVQEAAERSGFADGPHLTRTFRDWLGVSPSAWARASRVVHGKPALALKHG